MTTVSAHSIHTGGIRLGCLRQSAFGVLSDLEILSVVALLEDFPEHGLVRGQVGTVVEALVPAYAKLSSATKKEKPTRWRL